MCNDLLAKRVDQEMAAQWKVTLAHLRREDRDNRREKMNVPDMAEGLLQSQRAWLRYREAECSMVSDQLAGGTGYGDEFNLCSIVLTRRRTKILKLRVTKLSPKDE